MLRVEVGAGDDLQAGPEQGGIGISGTRSRASACVHAAHRPPSPPAGLRFCSLPATHLGQVLHVLWLDVHNVEGLVLPAQFR